MTVKIEFSNKNDYKIRLPNGVTRVFFILIYTLADIRRTRKDHGQRTRDTDEQKITGSFSMVILFAGLVYVLAVWFVWAVDPLTCCKSCKTKTTVNFFPSIWVNKYICFDCFGKNGMKQHTMVNVTRIAERGDWKVVYTGFPVFFRSGMFIGRKILFLAVQVM